MSKTFKNTILICLLSLFVAVGGIFIGYSFSSDKADANFQDELKAYYIDGSDDSTIGYTTVDGAFESAPDLHGLKVQLMERDKLIIRQVIDLKQMTKEDSIVKVSVAPDQIGLGQFFNLKIDVVDVYDSTNFFTIQIKPYSGLTNETHAGYFLTCASNGQAFTAKDRNSETIHVNQWGLWTTWSFGADKARTKLEPQDQYISFGYDIRENASYAHCTNGAGIKLLADYNDPLYFNNDLWKGFTTGEVYLRIYCEEYEASYANLVIQQYGNVDLTEEYVENTAGPKITIDYDGYNDYNLPDGVVGKVYSLPKATAFDIYSGEMNVDVTVYRNYYSGNKVAVPVSKRLNNFTPSLEGTYYVEYLSKDNQGVSSVKVLQINVVSATEEMEFIYGAYDSSVTVGELFTLPTYEVTGGSGRKSVVLSVYNEGQILTQSKGQVRPSKSGELKLIYTATDYLGQEKNNVVKVNVIATDKPTFIERPVLPNTFIDGNRYILPVINGYNFIDGNGAAVPTVITAKTAGGQDAGTMDGNVFTPNVATDGEIITVTYAATISGKTDTLKYQIPVIKIRTADGFDMSKMFSLSNNTTVSANADEINFYTTASSGKVNLIPAVNVVDFSAEWLMNEKSANMSKFSIVLTDYADSDNVVKFSYDSTGYVYINDRYDTRVTMDVSFGNDVRMSIKYNNNNKQFAYNINGNNVLTAETNMAGEEFNGFTDHTYYVSFEMEGVKESAGFSFGIICGHYFSNETTEWTAPVISIDGAFGGSYSINSEITLTDAFAFDMIDGETDLYLSVTDADGAFIKDVDGNVLKDYYVRDQKVTVKFTTYGTHIVKYVSSDNQFNSATKSYAINIIDEEGPQITIDEDIVKECEVGDLIYLPSATVTDNSDTEVAYRLYVIIPTGEMIMVNRNVNEGIKASLVGKYVVIYTATDIEGNCTLLTKEVIVKEAE